MNTSVLTPAQQKKTLSAKGNAKKRSLRNILATPYKNYWPVVTAEDNRKIQETLEQHLIKIVEHKIKIPWNELKNVPREERKNFRLQYNKPHNTRTDLVFGVNETTKLLEKNQASSILIAENVDPRLLVKHILDMAVLQNIPVLIIPNLKDVLKIYTGISSIAVAIKANTNIASNYRTIDLEIRKLSVRYPPPHDHINVHRQDDLIKVETKCESGSDDETKLQFPQDVYLHRDNKSSRVFVPEISKARSMLNVITKMDIGKFDFISLDSEDFNVVPPKKKAKISYKSLLIKQVTNNCNRDKKKIQLLKKKK